MTYLPLRDRLLAAGETSMDRRDINSSIITLTSNSLRLSYFTALRTETISQVFFKTGATAAGATPTVVQAGIWIEDEATGDLTNVALTTNDTTLMAAANTEYTKALAASFQKVAGRRYAAGLLVVTAATAPIVYGGAFFIGSDGVRSPKIMGLVGSQTSIAAGTITNASIGGSSLSPAITLLP